MHETDDRMMEENNIGVREEGYAWDGHNGGLDGRK